MHCNFEPQSIETAWSAKERNLNSKIYTTKGEEWTFWKKILLRQANFNVKLVFR